MTKQAESGAHDVAAEAEKLRKLHVAGDPLILANVRDPTSARVVESAGMRAIGTSSNALAARISVASFLSRLLIKRLQIATDALRRLDDEGFGSEWQSDLLQLRL